MGGVTATAPSIDTGSPENVAAKVSEGSVEVLESWLHVSPVLFFEGLPYFIFGTNDPRIFRPIKS